MSRGLGKLQRAILATLDEARESQTAYPGGDSYEGGEIGWVKTYGAVVMIAPHVYDLRASASYLASQDPKNKGFGYTRFTIKENFRAAFSRAIASLVKRGYLTPVEWLPFVRADQIPFYAVTGTDPSTALRCLRLPEGRRVIRFVTRVSVNKDLLTLIKAKIKAEEERHRERILSRLRGEMKPSTDGLPTRSDAREREQ